MAPPARSLGLHALSHLTKAKRGALVEAWTTKHLLLEHASLPVIPKLPPGSTKLCHWAGICLCKGPLHKFEACLVRGLKALFRPKTKARAALKAAHVVFKLSSPGIDDMYLHVAYVNLTIFRLIMLLMKKASTHDDGTTRLEIDRIEWGTSWQQLKDVDFARAWACEPLMICARATGRHGARLRPWMISVSKYLVSFEFCLGAQLDQGDADGHPGADAGDPADDDDRAGPAGDMEDVVEELEGIAKLLEIFEVAEEFEANASTRRTAGLAAVDPVRGRRSKRQPVVKPAAPPCSGVPAAPPP
jgi:hypothetical protein